MPVDWPHFGMPAYEDTAAGVKRHDREEIVVLVIVLRPDAKKDNPDD